MAFTATTSNSASAWRPDLFTFDASEAIPDALVLNYTNIRGAIEGDEPALRVAYVIDDDAEFVDEGAEIEESTPDLNEAVVYTKKIAQLIRITREQYRQAGTDTELARSVERAMTIKADRALLAQLAPVAPDVALATGLAHWPGQVTASGVGENLDKLIDLEAAVRSNGARPTAWIMAPDTWAALRKIKQTTESAVSILGAGTNDATPMVLSIPVEVNNQMPSKTGLLVDKDAVVSAVSQLEIATSADTYFSSDSVAVRATWRTGHTVPRPNRLGTFTLV
ncbi:phage major capsid protein [Mycobacteroides abscessus]|uniref:phage major capsid protein n=1 Tax=Mycobacteroides abscessus TaxID=36809 RepID=UPI0009A8FB30|nr:phage major capsid protein [Mycobacteroides abscessus]SLB85265.1 phage major capsid protein, HK97 [Mycobacteroides abscessus subsp. abscessus]